MRAFFLGLRIRIKLLSAFGSLLILSVLLIFFSIQSINRIISYKAINEQVDRLKLHLETLDLACKEFMYEGYKSSSFLEKKTTSSIQVFANNYDEAKEIIHLMAGNQLSEEMTSHQTNWLVFSLDSLHKDFGILVSLLQKRGFKDYGLEGELREAIHKVENSNFEFDRVTMLMLRRHEKDFFLRKDLKYQQEFNKRFDDFRQQVEPKAGGELLAFVDDYQTAFNKVVDIEKEIGLSQTEGIRGRIQKYFQFIRPQLEVLRTSIKEQNELQISRIKWILGIIFSVQIMVGIVMALVYANILTKSIKEIRNGMLQLASGIFPEKLRIRTSEEIGQTKLAFNQFIDRLKAATTFAEQIGLGKLTEKYDDQYANDVLAKSLLSAQEKLRIADEHQRKVNWMNEGAARFNDIFKTDSKEVKLMGDRILKFIVNYLQMNQGALYLISPNKSDEVLERIATYAYGRKRFVEDKIDFGNGLLGQCISEEATIYLKEIPLDFVKITSGLGEATPRNVIIVPLKTRSRVIGVIELASFSVLAPYQVEFIERIAENSANLLNDYRVVSEEVAF